MTHADSELDLELDSSLSPEDVGYTRQRHSGAGRAEDTHRAHARASQTRCEQAIVGARELYVYWKTHELNAALAAASRMQSVLCSRIDGLEAELLQRDGSPDGRFTVMEVYRHPQGIDGPLQALIANAAAPALAALMASPRVVEAFRRVES